MNDTLGLRCMFSGRRMKAAASEARTLAIKTANTHPFEPVELHDLDSNEVIETIYPDPSPDDLTAAVGDGTPYEDTQGPTGCLDDHSELGEAIAATPPEKVEEILHSMAGREIMEPLSDPKVYMAFTTIASASTARATAQRLADQTGKDINIVDCDTHKVLQVFRRKMRK